MESNLYKSLKEHGFVEDRSDPLFEHLTALGRTKEGWSQVQQAMLPWDEIPWEQVKADCEHCNGTGVVRHAKIGGSLTTIICSCLFADKERLKADG